MAPIQRMTRESRGGTMNNLAKLFVVAALVAAGCVTSEPIDITAPTGTGGNPSLTGQAGTGAFGGSSGGVAGAAGGGAAGAGAAGATAGSSGGPAGVSGSAGTSAPQDAGANDTRTTTDAGAVADASAYAATWTDIYNKMLNNVSYASNCTGGGCHDPGTQKGLDLSTQAKGYTTIKGKLSVGNPGASNVVSQLSGGKMPQARPKMPVA